MKSCSYKPTGFDYMRLLLACGVIVQHSFNVSYGLGPATEMFHTWLRPIFAVILPMFFALSGFLVAGSLFRCRSLVSFMSLRIIRLIPALACEVLLSAILIGPLISAVPISAYFDDQELYVYFFNIIGYIHYELPGVFLDNPWPRIVNTQLWTIPYELKCYVALAALAITRIVWHRAFLLAMAIGVQFLLMAYVVTMHPQLATLVSGRILVFCFVWGIIFYIYRERVVLSPALFAGSGILTLVLLSVPGGDYLIAIPATYVTAYLGLQTPRKPKFLFSGDYSYGMYLYGFPIQQLVASVSPLTHHWLVNILISVPLAFLIANISWRLVESPALRLKSRIPVLEDKILGVVPSRLRTLVLAA